jgi:hypothetical protein
VPVELFGFACAVTTNGKDINPRRMRRNRFRIMSAPRDRLPTA